jgi:hypothetical protein
MIRRFLAARGHRDAGRAGARLRHQLRLAAGARRHLHRVGRLRQFVRQARPFLRSVRLNAKAGILATDLLQARHRPQQRRLRVRLRQALRQAARWPSETYGSRAGIEGLTGNVIDGYVASVRDRDRRRHAHRAR